MDEYEWERAVEAAGEILKRSSHWEIEIYET